MILVPLSLHVRDGGHQILQEVKLLLQFDALFPREREKTAHAFQVERIDANQEYSLNFHAWHSQMRRRHGFGVAGLGNVARFRQKGLEEELQCPRSYKSQGQALKHDMCGAVSMATTCAGTCAANNKPLNAYLFDNKEKMDYRTTIKSRDGSGNSPHPCFSSVEEHLRAHLITFYSTL